MKKIALVPENKTLLKNAIFGSGKGNPITQLKKYLATKKIQLNTFDLYSDLKQVDAFLVFNFNGLKQTYLSPDQIDYLEKAIQPKFTLLYECPAILRNNLDPKYHGRFDLMFTWNDDLIDNRRYFKFNFPQTNKTKYISHTIPKDRKLLTLINAHKYSYHPDELYSYRRKAIRYFEQYASNDFDLFGRRWNSVSLPTMSDIFESLVHYHNPQALIDRFFPETEFPSYRGEVSDKNQVLNQYKFAICFENMTNINGYVTEKIWDCFKVRTVPIYLGASNINEIVPKECYIDMRDFESFSQLYKFLKKMSAKKYHQYIQAINRFYPKATKSAWFDEHWAKQVGIPVINYIKSHE